MRAILIATSIFNGAATGGSRPVRREACSPLSPLIDRPFLHHVLATIVDLGVHEIHFVVFDRSDFLESLLGNGQRWGSAFVYHAVPRNGSVYSELFRMIPAQSDDELILLAHADVLPAIEGLAGPPFSPAIFLSGDELPDWTGWALVTYAMLRAVAPGADAYRCVADWRDRLRDGIRLFHMPGSLLSGSFEQLLQAQDRVLGKKHAGLVWSGREIADSIWMGWNTSVHRTAKLIAPVYIGENCSIGCQTQLGPGVTVGKGSVIGRFAHLERSMVYPGSYVGDGLEVRDSIVRGNTLVNTRLGAEIHDMDDILLGQAAGPSLTGWLYALIERAFAALLLLAASLFLVLLMSVWALQVKGWPLESTEFLAEPAAARPERWRSFRLSRRRGVRQTPGCPHVRAHFTDVLLPGLWNVLRGDLAWTGHAPISISEARELQQAGLLERPGSKAGLIHGQLFGEAKDPAVVSDSARTLCTRYIAGLFAA